MKGSLGYLESTGWRRNDAFFVVVVDLLNSSIWDQKVAVAILFNP